MPKGAVASVLAKAGKKKTIFLERVVFRIIRPYLQPLRLEADSSRNERSFVTTRVRPSGTASSSPEIRLRKNFGRRSAAPPAVFPTGPVRSMQRQDPLPKDFDKEHPHPGEQSRKRLHG